MDTLKNLSAIPAEKDFFSSPAIVEHDALLRELGVVRYIRDLNQEIQNYQSLLTGAADVFNRTAINEIMDTAVRRLSEWLSPSFVVFIWKPHQNKHEVTVKGYKDNKVTYMPVNISTLAPFEPFFQTHREPVLYGSLVRELEPQGREGGGREDALRALEELRPELVVPILGPSGLYGLILVGPTIASGEYTGSELNYMGQLMFFVALAIQNNLHYEHSVRDVKTGLFNHGFFSSRFSEEVSQTRRTGAESSLIVIDVDWFKPFNDTYGHLAGDRVLESLALTIKQNIRTGDIPSRFGGEEFTVLLPNTDQNAALQVAERLKTAVADMRVSWERPLPPVTISLGIVTFSKGADASPDEILNQADEALYKSKADGRNRITSWMAKQ